MNLGGHETLCFDSLWSPRRFRLKLIDGSKNTDVERGREIS